MKFNTNIVGIATILPLILFSLLMVFSCSATENESSILDINGKYTDIKLSGRCYEFFESHNIGEFNHIGPLWFSSSSSIITVRFVDDFELIVDGVVQDVKPPMSVFLFRFRGFGPMPIKYKDIVGGKEFSLLGSCEAYVCDQDVAEDNIDISPLFEVTDFFDLGAVAWGVSHNDFDEDGLIDFAVSSYIDILGKPSISIFYNERDNVYTRKDVFSYDWEEYGYINDLESADFDGDGDVDLMVTYSESVDIGEGLMAKTNGTVNLLCNDGSGHFSDLLLIARHCSDVEEEFGRFNPHITSADFDGDGDVDFCVGDNSGSIQLYWNDGSGVFESDGVLCDYGQLSWGVSSGDFDGDGDVDLLVAAEFDGEPGNGRICLKRNQFIESGGVTCFASGTGEDVIYIQSGRGSCSLDVMDYNGDGLLDFVAGLTSVTVFLNVGDGFDYFYVGELPGEDGYVDHLYYGGMTSFDMDLDGREDLITGGVQGHVRFCLNNFSAFLPPLKPSISGDTYFVGDLSHEFEYTIYSKDVNDDDMYYFVDWGDGMNSGWIGPYSSGEEIVLNHTWNSYGGYWICVQAKDSNGQLSSVKTIPLVFLNDRKVFLGFDGLLLNPFLYGLYRLLDDCESYDVDELGFFDEEVDIIGHGGVDTIYDSASFISTNSVVEWKSRTGKK